MRKQNILFVDDEPAMLEILRRMLRNQDESWEASFAQSADEALQLSQQTAFDVIVTDVRMPGMDGFGLLTALREGDGTSDVPVIILTGEGEPTLKRRALDMGATDLLNKPCDREDLLARIRSALRIKAYQDEIKTHNQTLEQRVRERTGQLEASRREIIWRLAKAGEYRDDVTGNHVARVACYSHALARAMGADDEFIQMLMLTSPLHDIGKIGIPDNILLKPGKLTKEEWTLMKRHCAMGAEILSGASALTRALFNSGADPNNGTDEDAEDNPLLTMASTIARGHHERWDGAGYPAGCANEVIPLECRIVTIADVYDALRSERPYKAAMPEDKAIGIMRKDAGRHFAPDVFEAFETVLDEFHHIREKLSDPLPADEERDDRS